MGGRTSCHPCAGRGPGTPQRRWNRLPYKTAAARILRHVQWFPRWHKAGPMPPARPAIGFVFPQPFAASCSHKSFSRRYLSFIRTLARLALFRTFRSPQAGGGRPQGRRPAEVCPQSAMLSPRTPIRGRNPQFAIGPLALFGTNGLRPSLKCEVGSGKSRPRPWPILTLETSNLVLLQLGSFVQPATDCRLPSLGIVLQESAPRGHSLPLRGQGGHGEKPGKIAAKSTKDTRMTWE